MILIDSSMWLEYFSGTELGKVIRDNPALKKHEFIVPAIVVYEVHKKLLLEYNEDIAVEYTLYLHNGEIVDFNYNLAVFASRVSIENKLPMADSIIYATSIMYNVILYTSDHHFKNFKGVKYFDKKNY